MDVLTDVLQSIHVKGFVFGRFELSAPWGFEKGAGEGLAFCVVTRGTFWLEVADMPPLQVGGGDLLLIKKTHSHVMRDALDSPVLPIEALLQQCPHRRNCQPGGIFRHGGDGAETTMIGGRFDIDNDIANPLLASLPPVIHVRGDRGVPVQWMEATLQFIAAEMLSGQPGAETVVNRLADVLFVQALRAHLSADSERRGWLRALVDRQVGQALAMIHEQPEQAWTVEALASRVGMSRSAFAARFTELVQEPPLTYLTRWRMTKASHLLRSSSTSVGQVAGRVGYDAEAAFSKAFKRWTGSAPGAWAFRRAALAPSIAPAG
jgi:AraC-like DNA-binding protein